MMGGGGPGGGPPGKAPGPPPAVKKVLSMFGSGREEDKMVRERGSRGEGTRGRGDEGRGAGPTNTGVEEEERQLHWDCHMQRVLGPSVGLELACNSPHPLPTAR